MVFIILKSNFKIVDVWIQRRLEKKLANMVPRFAVTAITGARRTGKTALAKEVLENAEFVSLDLPMEADLAQGAPLEFLERAGEPLIIDEAQYAPNLFRYLKYVVDQEPEKRGRYVLTGSQQFVLMKELSESLAGRVGIFEVDTLSWFELRDLYQKRKRDRGDFLWRGGYPELHAEEDADVQAFFSSYLAAYMERDLRNLLQVTNLRDFHRFLRMLAFRNGQLMNMSEMARDVGISVPTVKAWLGALEASQLVYILEPFHRNLGKRTVKTPKVYFRDTGILCALWGVEKESDIWGSGREGVLWETYVLNELVKARPGGGNWRNIYFYRESQGLEVDFVVGGVKPRLIEAKYVEIPTERDWAPLKKLREKMGQDVTWEVTVVCRSGGNYDVGDGVRLSDGFESTEWLGVPAEELALPA
jgi:predicted AAA+ superfamily ATPase